jgi:hypothetical protein
MEGFVTDRCTLCSSDINNTHHLFIDCEISKKIWQYTSNLANQYLQNGGIDHEISISPEEKIIGANFTYKSITQSVKSLAVGITQASIWGVMWNQHTRNHTDLHQITNAISSNLLTLLKLISQINYQTRHEANRIPVCPNQTDPLNIPSAVWDPP